MSRSIFALTNDTDRAYFGMRGNDQDQVGIIDNTTARFGCSYAVEPDKLIEQLEDEAIAAADNLLPTVPNQLGVDSKRPRHRVDPHHVAPASAGAETE